MATVAGSHTTASVRRQYEALPYPHRDPQEESQRLLATSCDDLKQLNCYCYRGRRNFSDGFRVLVAGGGTGDATVFLAEQLRDRGAEIIHLDLSTASIEVARQRIRRRGLQRSVRFVQQSLLDLPTLGLGEFDYINCCGVLHHLADPPEGLKTLADALKPEGAMMLMVYGQYARTGVYQMQELMRLITDGKDDPREMIDLTRRTIRSLPDTNWYRRGEKLFGVESGNTDAEIYDLLLHSQDRAYNILQLYQFLDTVGLKFVEFAPEFRLCFEPSLVFPDPEIRRQVEALPLPLMHHACELMWGAVKKHIFWTSPSSDTFCNPRDDESVPEFGFQATAFKVPQAIRDCKESVWKMEVTFTMGLTLNLGVELNQVTRPFFALVDGRRTMGEIIRTIARQMPGTPPEQIREVCLQSWNTLRAHDLMVMRHQSGG
ncbi:MAG: class I SAM-dependent methyltransferase [Pirellulaceae bacterium]